MLKMTVPMQLTRLPPYDFNCRGTSIKRHAAAEWQQVKGMSSFRRKESPTDLVYSKRTADSHYESKIVESIILTHVYHLIYYHAIYASISRSTNVFFILPLH